MQCTPHFWHKTERKLHGSGKFYCAILVGLMHLFFPMTPFSRHSTPLKTHNGLPSYLVPVATLLIGALLQAAPVIQNQPVSQTANVLESVTFSVDVTSVQFMVQAK